MSLVALWLTSPSSVGNVSSILDGRAEILHASRLKNQNINHRSNTVTNSVKTLKMVHIKKKKKKKEKKEESWVQMLTVQKPPLKRQGW